MRLVIQTTNPDTGEYDDNVITVFSWLRRLFRKRVKGWDPPTDLHALVIKDWEGCSCANWWDREEDQQQEDRK